MIQPQLPLTHDLVLIGGGHTHALVLRKWGMAPLPGARLTVIHPGPTAPYSGMLPGFVAGHYTRSDLDIDLVRLARFAGARIVVGAATGLDLDARQIHVAGRPPIGYDVASFNVGITSEMPALPGFAEHGIPAKPLDQFAAKWARFLNAPDPGDVVVIGGGVAGAELAMAMAHALKSRGQAGQVTLIDAKTALSAAGDKARSRILNAMQELGVTLMENTGIAAIRPDHLMLSDGRQLPARFITGAAGAHAQPWVAQTGLAHQDGFISVDRTLRSSDANVFAAGDCAHLTETPRPKAGVYAVREAPVLFENLRAVLTGEHLRPYRPQKDYLKLISLGGKRALAEKFNTTFSGSLMWRWKDRIDQAFMDQFRELPAMDPAELPALHTTGLEQAVGDKPLCGGCGAKIGRASLHRALNGALAGVTASTRADISPLPGDDAALLHTGGARQVLTTDHLRSLTNDPALMTRIAAIHALGDIWAMGAAPQAATATVILPRLSPPLQDRTLAEIMAVASDVMGAAGADIVGGHTSLGDELTIGFTITGLCDRDPITLAGGQPGDALILTKPLGSGVLMAAEMAGLAQGDWIISAFAQMTLSQAKAAPILSDAHAMTDVTGFGLAGHLLGMCEASGTGARLDLAAIPAMDGAVAMAQAGVQSSLFADNRALAPELPETGKAALLFDPQTAGGLLAAVAPDKADDLVAQLLDQGYAAARIGQLTKGAARLVLD